MSWLIGGWSHDWQVAAKAVLMYGTALAALRLGERRTLAQWTIIDFATAVAMGAVIGRTAVADTQSYVTGAVALVTLVAVHRLASLLRFRPVLGKLFDHRVRVLVVDGKVRTEELRRCGLTDNDLASQLRQRGIFDYSGLRLVLYESKGALTVVPREAGEPPLVQVALDDATALPEGLR